MFEQTERLFKAINRDLTRLFYDSNDQNEYGNHLISYVRDSEGHVLFDENDQSRIEYILNADEIMKRNKSKNSFITDAIFSRFLNEKIQVIKIFF